MRMTAICGHLPQNRESVAIPSVCMAAPGVYRLELGPQHCPSQAICRVVLIPSECSGLSFAKIEQPID